MNPRGAVEIDKNEHIYAHPDFAQNLQDHREFRLATSYEMVEHGIKNYGSRKMFSYRYASTEPFQSYTFE